MNLEDRTKVGRWLDHASAMARKVERNHAADRAAAALADYPELAERARAAVLAGDPQLWLARTGVEGNLIVGILHSPDGTFRMKASPSAWADLEADVAAGRNPVVLKPPTDTEEEIDS